MSKKLRAVYNRKYRNKRKCVDINTDESSAKQPRLTATERVRQYRQRKLGNPKELLSKVGVQSSIVHCLQEDLNVMDNEVADIPQSVEPEIVSASNSASGDLASPNVVQGIRIPSGELKSMINISLAIIEFLQNNISDCIKW